MSILRKLKNLLKRFLPIPANSFYAALDELKQFFRSIHTGIAAENRKQINDASTNVSAMIMENRRQNNDASTNVSAMIMENRRQINDIVTDVNWEIRKIVISNKQVIDEYKEEINRQVDMSALRMDEIGKTLENNICQTLNESRKTLGDDICQTLNESRKTFNEDVGQQLDMFGKMLKGDVSQEIKNNSQQQKDQYLDLSLMQKEIVSQIGQILEVQRQQQAMIEKLMKLVEKPEQ